jgi:hypothetical protein
VFDRGPHPVIVLDREGNFLRAWGEGDFKRPHAVHVAEDDTVWLTDDSNHVVRRYSPEGKLLLSLGQAGQASPYMSGIPFNKCTHTALSPEGDVYVSDGYGNAQVHKYSPDGRLLLSWGGPDTGRGEFNIPHNITCEVMAGYMSRIAKITASRSSTAKAASKLNGTIFISHAACTCAPANARFAILQRQAPITQWSISTCPTSAPASAS